MHIITTKFGGGEAAGNQQTDTATSTKQPTPNFP